MKFSELVTRNENMSFKDVLPVLLPIYMNAHNWNVDDSINTVYEKKRKYILDKILIAGIENKAIDGKVVYDYEYDEFDLPIISTQEPILITSRSCVNIKSLIKHVVSDIKDIAIIPDELLIAAGIEPPKRNISDLSSPGDGDFIKDNAFYEDIISDETILKLKELPLPKMKQQVAMLAAEKKKTDAAIMAAAKIGLLFYEESLQKPANEKLFITEYKKHLDKFPALPDTTIKRLYKNLPDGYRFTREGGQIPCEQTDMRPVIKAAALAGSMAHERGSMNVVALKKSLSLEQYAIPSDDILEDIIAAVMKLEIEEID